VISILEWEFINTNIDINTDQKKNSSAFAREKIDTNSIAKIEFFGKQFYLQRVSAKHCL
jgi:hypothetical protein